MHCSHTHTHTYAHGGRQAWHIGRHEQRLICVKMREKFESNVKTIVMPLINSCFSSNWALPYVDRLRHKYVAAKYGIQGNKWYTP